ncbi:hypothetical protein MTO96_000586 [Rhipicephalus appendiculatus]
MQKQPLISLLAVCLNRKLERMFVNVEAKAAQIKALYNATRHCPISTNVTSAFLQHPLPPVNKSAMMCRWKALGTKRWTQKQWRYFKHTKKRLHAMMRSVKLLVCAGVITFRQLPPRH